MGFPIIGDLVFISLYRRCRRCCFLIFASSNPQFLHSAAVFLLENPEERLILVLAHIQTYIQYRGVSKSCLSRQTQQCARAGQGQGGVLRRLQRRMETSGVCIVREKLFFPRSQAVERSTTRTPRSAGKIPRNENHLKG